MSHWKSSIWDRGKVAFHPHLFYESYFQDYQYLMDLRQRGNSRIQSFNVKVTRREWKPQADVVASCEVNREKLQAKFRTALNSIYEAFEEAFAFEQPDIVIELWDQLVNLAVAHMANLFVSSRCRTCYKGRQQDAAWRRSRFHPILPLLSKISPEVYCKVEEHQAIILLMKTAIEDDAPLPDTFKLGFTEEDIKIYNALSRRERRSFEEELKVFVRINSPIRLSQCWDRQKDTLPVMVASLNHAALQRIRQLRRQNLLPIAQALLHRFKNSMKT